MRYIKITIIISILTSPWSYAKSSEITPDQVRQMVATMLQSKSEEMARMNQKIQELERLTQEQRKMIQQLQTNKGKVKTLPEQPATSTPSLLAKTEQSLNTFFFPEKESTAEMDSKEVEHSGPEISGFFDTTAQTKNGSNQIFHVGIVELDFDRIIHKGDFAASVALDWFPFDDSVGVGAAFIDFHLYDEAIPVRGRIFQDPGFHIQVGQFDLPFSSDYQFFAVTDRLTVTPPMTTTRIQQSGDNPANGGLNAPGIRTYGKWNHVTYAAYAVNSIYSTGVAVGGRLGYTLDNPYQLHAHAQFPLVDFGVSYLRDMDQSEHKTDELYAIDLAFNYKNVRLISEFVLRDSNSNRQDGNPELNETAFHVTLINDLHQWLHEDLYIYGRYQEWRPNYNFVDVDGTNYEVENIPAITVGLGYHINDFLMLKMEYTDTLSHKTAEPAFQTQTGIVQLIGSF